MNKYEQYLAAKNPKVPSAPPFNKIPFCLSCGSEQKDKHSHNLDHMLPKQIIHYPILIGYDIDALSHPLRKAVYSKDNVFKLCKPCHNALDKHKVPLTADLDLTDAIAYICKKYPITRDRKSRCQQLHRMMITFENYINGIENIDEENVPVDLVNAYKRTLPTARIARRHFLRLWLKQGPKRILAMD